MRHKSKIMLSGAVATMALALSPAALAHAADAADAASADS